MRIRHTTLLTLLGTTILATPAFAQTDTSAATQGAEVQVASTQDTGGAAQPTEAAQTAAAEQDDNSEFDIVVEARRRVEPLQDTPLTITAIDANRLEQARVTNITDLTSLSPSVTLARNTTNPVSLFPWIRGFGTKSTDPAQEPPISLTIDGVYQAQLIGSFVELNDVEAVEILRGPQGTLLGRNSPAGAVSIRTRRPGRDFGGAISADYSSWNSIHVRGHLDVPIVTDALYATFSASYRSSDGYMRNTLTGEDLGGTDFQSYRLGLLANLGQNVTWYISASYQHDTGEDAGNRNVSDLNRLIVTGVTYNVLPGVSLTCTNAVSADLCNNGTLPQRTPYTTRASVQPSRDSSNLSITSNLDVRTGPVDLAFVTGYRRYREFAFSDIDGTERQVIDSTYDGHYRTFSHEMRVASSENGGLDLDGRLTWLLGVYFFHNEYDRFNRQRLLGNGVVTYQEGRSQSYAIFGTAEFEITDGLKFSLGGRQTWDRKQHLSCANPCQLGQLAPISERASWDDFSYDATLSYEFTPDNMAYFRYATGYRGGGFTGVPANLAASSIANPETVQSYELGLKNDFFNRRLRVNIAAFRNEFSDLQRVVSIPINVAPFFVQRLLNVAEGVTQGIEVEVLARPTRGLTLRANLGYLDAKYTDFTANITGNVNNPTSDLTHIRFPYVSKWSGLIGATYDADIGNAGTLSFSADYNYRSNYFVTDLNYPFSYQDGFWLLSARVTWRDRSDRFSLSVYGRNLTDVHYIDGGDAVGGLTTYVSDGAPQEFGISAGFRF